MHHFVLFFCFLPTIIDVRFKLHSQRVYTHSPADILEKLKFASFRSFNLTSLFLFLFVFPLILHYLTVRLTVTPGRSAGVRHCITAVLLNWLLNDWKRVFGS